MPRRTVTTTQSLGDFNFLRFLTVTLPLGIEDPLLIPIFRSIPDQELHKYFSGYASQKHHWLTAKSMHLHVHVPFCATICSFCHCYHEELKDRQKLRTHTDFVLNQVKAFAPLFKGKAFGSFTILGGTASLMSPSEIKMIFDEVLAKFDFTKNAVFNFEGHPNSLSEDKLDVIARYGVKKIHLGVQSLDEKVLKNINRYQSRKIVKDCIDHIRARGMTCINTDIVAGLPAQSTQSFLDDIKTLMDWGVDLFNINPFSDISAVAGSKTVSIDVQETLSRRHEMILKAKALLESHGYGNKDQRGYLKGAAGESQKFEPGLLPGGVLGLGLLAKSNIPGQATFMIKLRGNDFDDGSYAGYPIDKRYAMSQYATLHLLYGLDTKVFKKIFGEDFASVFKEEIAVLMEQQTISRKNGTYAYPGTRTLKGLFDYFANAKLFLGEDILAALQKAYARQYNPHRDYGTQEDLLKVFENFEYAREYYQVGKKTLWL